MAIVLCKECRQEISSKAKACPHCGYPLEEEKDAFDDIEGKKSEHPFDEERKKTEDSQRQKTHPRRPGPHGPPGPLASPADSKATTGMVLSIVGFLLPIPLVDIILAIAGIIMGSQAQKMPNLRRRGQATAAIVVGVIALIFNVSYWLFMT